MLAAHMSDDSRVRGRFKVQQSKGVNAAGVPDHSTDSSQVNDVPVAAAATEGSGEAGREAGSADDSQDRGGLMPQPGIAAGGKCKQCSIKDQQLVEQQVHVAELDLQVRTMRADILRSTQLASQVGRVMLPALYSIESRLAEAVNEDVT
jgi:hypothetical protein